MRKIGFIILTFMLVTSSCHNYSGINENGKNFPLKQSLTLGANESIQELAISEDWAVIQTPGKLTAIDISTTDTLWTLDNFSSDENSRFKIIKDTFITANYEKILIINREGKEKSITLSPNEGDVIELIAIYDNYIYVIRGPSWTLEVYDIQQNVLLWDTWVGRGKTNAFLDSGAGIAYIVTPQSVRAYENLSGKLLWGESFNITNSYFKDGVLYLCEQFDDLRTVRFVALDPIQRIEIWAKDYSFDTGAKIYQLSINENTLIVTSRYYYLGIDKSNGNQIWRSEKIGDIFYNEPVVYNDILYARGSSGNLYAISIDDGKILSTFPSQENPPFESRYNASQKVYQFNNTIVISTNKDVIFLESK